MDQMTIHLPVTLDMSFEDLLGSKASEMPEPQRIARWEEWKSIAGRRDKHCLEVWTDTSECQGCKHLRGDWCSLMGLPATVNPILSFREAMPGFACMGFGYEESIDAGSGVGG